MEEKEIWKPIKGYEGMYEVSNLGRVKSLSRLSRQGREYGIHKLKGRILKDYIAVGYHQIRLFKEGKGKHFLVHRLVYEAFKGEIPEGFEVNHLDECKDNNSINNLNLLTHIENNKWGTRIERASRKCRKKVIMDDYKEFDSIREAAEYLGCCHQNVSLCCRNLTNTIYGHHFKYKEESKNEN